MNNTKEILLALAEAEEFAERNLLPRGIYASPVDSLMIRYAKLKATKLREIADRLGDDQVIMNTNENLKDETANSTNTLMKIIDFLK